MDRQFNRVRLLYIIRLIFVKYSISNKKIKINFNRKIYADFTKSIRASPALLVARGTGEEKEPDGRGMGLQRLRARGTGQA